MKKITFLIACCIMHGGIYAQSWLVKGNTGTNSGTNFIGTTDKKPLSFRVNNIQAGELNPSTGNIFWGLRAGQANTSGFSNIAIGRNALKNNTNRSNLVAIGDSALFNNNSSGFSNTAIGSKSLFSNTGGSDNTATGNQSLFSNITGSANTANGSFALFSNTTGVQNVAIGNQSLTGNTTGISNVATGALSLFSNTTGSFNIATGTFALSANISGANNIAIGEESLASNTTGSNNTAVGSQSLSSNTIGFGNTAVGNSALSRNTGGNGQFNTAVGFQSMLNTLGATFNTAIGFNSGSAFNMGFNNTIIGAQADINQNDLFNCVALGQGARCTGSSQVRFGNSATNSIGGVVGYSTLSDGRYKKNIQETVKGIDFIMKLRPVMYQLNMAELNKKLNINAGGKMDELSKKDINENEKTIFSGFVAQEVEQAAKDVKYDFSGVDKPKNENDFYGLRYSEFVVPLVKAVQELSKENDDLKSTLSGVVSKLAEVKKQLDELKISKSAPCTQLPSTDFARLEQNAPNPFNNSTVISYYIPSGANNASLTISNMNRQVLKTISLNIKGTGKTTITADELAAGNYFYTLFIDGRKADTRQMVISK